MKSMIKKNYILILFLLLTIFYFEYSVSITWDSAHYLGYIKVLERIAPVSSWDVVRGPIFPIVIFLGNVLFSKTSHGLLMNTYMYYLIMLFFVNFLIDYFFTKLKISNKYKNAIKIVLIMSIILNPIIYGYYHTLLTEFVAITLSVISSYFAILWLDADYKETKRKYLFISVLFMLLTIFSWFLKQPYVSCGFFSLLVSYIISIFKEKNLNKFIVRTLTVFSCILALFMSIKIWNVFLDNHGCNTKGDRNPTNTLGNQLITAVNHFKIKTGKKIYDKNFIKKVKLSSDEKKTISKLIKEDKKYVLIYKYSKKKLTDVDYIESDDGKNVSVFSSVMYLTKIFFENPIKMVDAYVTNYFSIIDIYETFTADGIGYISTKKINPSFSNEIRVIGTKPYSIGDTNLFPLSDELYENAVNYIEPNHAHHLLNDFMNLLSKVSIVIFKVVFFFLPFLLIVSLIITISKKYINYRSQLYLIDILLGFSFLHVMLHTVTGAIIDRYALPAYITSLLGSIMLIIVIICKRKRIK